MLDATVVGITIYEFISRTGCGDSAKDVFGLIILPGKINPIARR